MPRLFPLQGEIWVVSLDPTLGSEMKKTHPCVVLQNDLGNRYAPTTIIAPITSTPYDSPVVVPVHPTEENGLHHLSYINLAQIRCIDKKRLKERLGAISPEICEDVANALKKSLAL